MNNVEGKLKLFLAESEDFNPGVLSLLRKHFRVTVPEEEGWDLKEVLEEYDVFWFRLAYIIDHTSLSERTRCKYLVTPVTGVNHIDEAACAERGIKLICLRGERDFLKEVRATAEMTIGLSIALMRRMIPAMEDVKSGHWRRDLFRGYEIYKKTIGIVGIGRLGSIVASYFHAMGAKVLAYDPYRKSSDSQVEQVDDFFELLEVADIVSIHVNLSEETKNFFGRKAFGKMKMGSFLINTSRGELIDEDALLDALESGQLAGAALDVIADEYHITEAHPLISYSRRNNRLIIVPHIGGNTYESFEKTERFIADKLLRITGHVLT